MKSWKFTRADETTPEPVDGRTHFWHYNPKIVEGSNILTVRVILPPGGMHNFHKHPNMDEVLYILSGNVEQWVEDEMKMVGPGDSAYIPRDVVHATFNTGEHDAEILAILSPTIDYENGTVDVFNEEPYRSYR